MYNKRMQKLQLIPILGLFLCLPTFFLQAQNEKHLSVWVSIPPLAQFVEALAGDLVTVDVLLPAGRSPHDYEPRPSQLVQLYNADLVVQLGTGLLVERMWMKLGKKSQNICVAGQSISLIYGDHDSLNKHSHSKEEGDPHVWLSPVLAEELLGVIAEDLMRLLPQYKEEILRNYDTYERKLKDLDRQIKETCLYRASKTFFVNHPAWAYFTREYGLKQLPIEEHEQAPSAFHLKNYITALRHASQRIIFVSWGSSQKLAKEVAKQVDSTIWAVDPMARDYLANMKKILEGLRQ